MKGFAVAAAVVTSALACASPAAGGYRPPGPGEKLCPYAAHPAPDFIPCWFYEMVDPGRTIIPPYWRSYKNLEEPAPQGLPQGRPH